MDEARGVMMQDGLMESKKVTEDQFLGALLGMAIGDALGAPLRGMTEFEISNRYGVVAGYVSTAAESGAPAGQITDKSEIGLCIVESLTMNDGVVDVDNVLARMTFVERGNTTGTMSAATLAGLKRANEGDGDLDEVDPAELPLVTRGIPIGLLHAIGVFDYASLLADADTLTHITHRGSMAEAPARSAALLVVATARDPADPAGWLGAHVATWHEHVPPAMHEVAATVTAATVFEDGVLATVRQGGEADALGALAGALAGVRFGASGIPQALIDDLDARIYLSLAAPWFYRTALRRQGTVIDLRTI